jgi:VWFA-related protein
MKSAILFAALVGIGLPASCQTPANDSVLVIHVDVNLVVLDAQVLNKKTGRTAGHLKREDFQLFEDGVRQEIVSFSQDELPLSIALLFDLTESVQPVLKPLAAGALEALEHLKPEDEVAVMVYAASSQLIQDFTTDRKLAVAAIEKASGMKSDEAAFFNEGVYQATAQLGRARNPSSRRVIVWLTDSVPNIPSESNRRSIGQSVPEGALHTESEAFRELFETGSVLSARLERSALSDLAIAFYSRNPLFASSRKHNPSGDVYKYAEQTGGQVMKSGKEEVSAKLALLIDDIRARYSLGYRPSADQPKGTFCEIRVKMSPEVEKRAGALVVKTKRGYYR